LGSRLFDEQGNEDLYYRGQIEKYACDVFLDTLVKETNNYINQGKTDYAFNNVVVPPSFDKYRKVKVIEKEVTNEEVQKLKAEQEKISQTLLEKIKKLLE